MGTERTPLLEQKPSGSKQAQTIQYGAAKYYVAPVSSSKYGRSLVLATVVGAAVVCMLGLVIALPAHLRFRRDQHFWRAAVVSDSPDCAQVGSNTLLEGGSAVDAALAVMLCQSIVSPLTSGLGGGCTMIVYQQKRRAVEVLDALEMVPNNSHLENLQNKTGVLSAAIPGMLSGLWEAHKKYGVLPWNKLINPAIDMALSGVRVSKDLANSIEKFHGLITADTTMKNIFTNQSTGHLLTEGDLLQNRKLANTLREIAKMESNTIFTLIADSLEHDIKLAGGNLSAMEIKMYRAKWRSPVYVNISAKGKPTTLVTTPSPTEGPRLAAIFSVWDSLYALQNGTFTSNYSAVLHYLAKAFEYGFLHSVLNKDKVELHEELVELPYTEKVTNEIKDAVSLRGEKQYEDTEKSDASSLCVIAPNGDVVVATSSLGSKFGSGVMLENSGIILNNQLAKLDLQNYRIQSGLQLPAMMSPCLFLDKDQNVVLALSASGGTHTSSVTAFVAVHRLYLGESLWKSVQCPRIYQLANNVLYFEKGLSDHYKTELKYLGYKLQEQELYGSIVTGLAKSEDGSILVAADQRREGTVSGIN